MKTILLPVEANSTMESGFAMAELLSQKFGARVDCIAMKPNIVTFVSADPVMVVVPQPSQGDGDAEKAARALFDRHCAAHPLAPADAGAKAGIFKWNAQGPLDDTGLASSSRLYDLTIVGRPGLKQSEPRMTTLESSLFESGRPIMMAPPNVPKSLGTTILIHWNASSETARAINDAMPLLRRADKVAMVTVEGNLVAGPKATEMLDYLAAHDIRATETTVKPAARGGAGEAILTEARRIGADLLIKGAYTQSRLRQMIFGGATQHILQTADIPVLLSH